MLRAIAHNTSLSRLPADVPKIVAFESVYSMDGDIAPIGAIVEAAEERGTGWILWNAAGNYSAASLPARCACACWLVASSSSARR